MSIQNVIIGIASKIKHNYNPSINTELLPFQKVENAVTSLGKNKVI